MFLNLLHRMILWELIKIFVLSLVGLTGIYLMAGVVVEASQQGLGPGKVLAIIPLLIPSSLPYTIPATTLFATCLVYGRLAADNEILAVKSAGVNVLKMVWPSILLGLMVSSITMGLSYAFIPLTHHWLREQLVADVEEFLYTMLKKDHCISHPALEYSLVVREVKGRKLEHAIIKRFKASEKKKTLDIEMAIDAQEAELEVDLVHRCLKIRLYFCNALGRGGGNSATFNYKEEVLDLPTQLLNNKDPSPRNLTWQELSDKKAMWLEKIKKIDQEEEKIAAGDRMGHEPDQVPKHRENLEIRRSNFRRQIQQLDTEFQMRPALSLGCLCFVLIGCPVGIWFSRSDYLSAFITCFLPIVFIYYPLLLCGTNYAKDNLFHPAWTVWGADALMGLAGLILLWKLQRT